MKSIVRKYVIVTSMILSLTFLATGIISVNDETSYVINGKRREVLRVQSTTSEKLLVSTQDETDTEIFSVNSDDLRSAAVLLSGILPSPFAQIVWSLL